MRVQDYLAKISWTAADKILFVLYGFVALLQIRAIAPAEFGLYALLVSLQTWIFILSDGAALQSIIQFGMEREARPRVNSIALILHIAITLSLSLLTALFSSPLSSLFSEPRFSSVALWLPFYCAITLPRAYCIKVLLRDTQMRQVFWVNFFWFASMTVLTAYMLQTHRLNTFDDMITISFSGMALSSLVAILLTRKIISFSFRELSSFRDFLRFGSIQVGIGAITNAIRQLDIFVLQIFFHDLAIVGIYNAAKTLYRVFETGMDALFSLVYPSAIRLLPQGKNQEFSILLSKAVSYLFISYSLIIIAMESGLTEILIHVLGGKYSNVTHQFNLLALAALFVPFYPLSAALLAMNRNALLLRYVIIASLSGMIVFCISGALSMSSIFPLGVVTYNAVLSALLLIYTRDILSLPLHSFLRAVPDTLRFIQQKVSR